VEKNFFLFIHIFIFCLKELRFDFCVDAVFKSGCKGSNQILIVKLLSKKKTFFFQNCLERLILLIVS